VRMEVPFYEPRNVEIQFGKWSKTPSVRVDGPGSPHRYPDGTLCMWYPPDPEDEKWVFEDGLLPLLCHIQRHLFREAWWREHGVWLGPQAPHGPPKEPVVEDEPHDAAPRRQQRGR
jgi:hypothetical protein